MDMRAPMAMASAKAPTAPEDIAMVQVLRWYLAFSTLLGLFSG